MKLELNVDYVRDLLEYEAKSLVGKILKRHEIIDNKNILKNEVKELIYEEMRNIRNLLIASGRESEKIVWRFNNREKG